ncbi:MAG: endoribonuclease YbeY [Candidatus Sericytochromatia bacterium]|nr:MAG: endoribonuclease YbeY [Candidatus Sericytochromatia bacterium]
MKIFINNYQNILKIKKREIKKFVTKVLNKLKLNDNTEISITFVNNKKIKELNNNYRNIDKETDVLSFPFENNFNLPINILGDIIISTEKAISQSKDYNHSIEREIYFLIVHGILHLLGYDHKDVNEEEEMFSLQKEILNEIVPNLSR